MRYTLEVWLPKNKFWALVCKTKDMIVLGNQIIKVKKQGHKYRVVKGVKSWIIYYYLQQGLLHILL